MLKSECRNAYDNHTWRVQMCACLYHLPALVRTNILGYVCDWHVRVWAIPYQNVSVFTLEYWTHKIIDFLIFRSKSHVTREALEKIARMIKLYQLFDAEWMYVMVLHSNSHSIWMNIILVGFFPASWFPELSNANITTMHLDDQQQMIGYWMAIW